MNCGHQLLKYILFFFNFIFWILGLAVLAFGIYSIVKAGNYEALLDKQSLVSAANILVASGALVMVIGFFGCCGAIKNNKCMLTTYVILVGLIFALEIAAGVLAYTNKGKFTEELKTNLNVVFKNYGKPDQTDAEKAMQKALDWFQEEVQCCGVNGPDDWTSSFLKKIPSSCCPGTPTVCTKPFAYQMGCWKKGDDWVSSNIVNGAGVAIGIAVVQLFVMIAACCLCRAKNDEERLA